MQIVFQNYYITYITYHLFVAAFRTILKMMKKTGYAI